MCLTVTCLPSSGIRGGTLSQLDIVRSQTTLKLSGLKLQSFMIFHASVGEQILTKPAPISGGLLGII